jgi:membrane protein YdbS with pleckstrin-like domain
MIGFGIVLFATGPAELAPWLVLGGWLVPAIAIAAAGILLPRKAYEATTYAISPLGLEIRRGIWWKHMVDVPRARIQHTDVQQGPLARHYGIGKLVVYTAGTEHASVTLDGLEHGRAIQMRDFLLRGGEDDAV